MPQIKVLIVEDEFSIALDIQMRLQKMAYQVVGIAHNYEQALQQVQEQSPTIILMDINLSKGKTGIEAAQDIYRQYQIPVVFLTAYGDDKTFKEALLAQPFGYVLKPFKDQELNFALQVALEKAQETIFLSKSSNSDKLTLSDTLFVKDKSQFTAVKFEEIFWIEAMDNYVLIVVQGKKIIANLFLKDIEQKLPEEHFLRIHRSYIIALEKIEKIKDNSAYINGMPIPISKPHKNQLLKRLNIV